ncbi:MAG: SIMPL domain-containing protein [Bryobacterales bacterium]|nr:SIMPL domain-containing protein [Bryobacteraceae bacterium]MDW8130853.1 SIMPL domain-containing protein [Bryobacterales bacterium]
MKPWLWCLWFVLPAWTQEAQAPKAQIRASADAVVQARPDQAQIELGVISQAPTAQAAAAQNAAQLEAVLARLRKLLAGRGDIQTSGYSLTPNYRYPKDGKPEIAGYTASNIVEVRTQDLKLVGPVIDAATQAGANTIHSLRFTLRDDEALRLEALRQATRRAHARAEAMAAASGLKPVRIVSIELAPTAPIRPVRELAVARAAEVTAPTPVEPGIIEVHASVTVVVEAAP